MTADAEDAALNEAAMDAVEGVTRRVAVEAPPAEEAAAVDTATADLGAPAPEAAAETDAKPEPQFDEVWFPGGRRPDNKRPPRRERTEGATAAAPADGAEREHRPRPKRFAKPDVTGTAAAYAPAQPPSQRRRRSENRGSKASRKFEGKPKFDGKRNDPRPPVRERREPAFDPDSPFAALAALRNPKPE